MTNKKPIVILPLAAALAALGGASVAKATTGEQAQTSSPTTDAAAVTTKAEPNVLFKVGEDLFGLIVTRNADGTVLAQHYSHRSHSSHSSHSSHRSHYSSRY